MGYSLRRREESSQEVLKSHRKGWRPFKKILVVRRFFSGSTVAWHQNLLERIFLARIEEKMIKHGSKKLYPTLGIIEAKLGNQTLW